MTTEEFYKEIGGDYADISSRIPSDIVINQFLLKFPADPSYAALAAARERRDIKGAFLSAHTLRGVAATLGLKKLTETVAMLTDALRPLSRFPDDALFDSVAKAYDQVIRQIAALLR